jgi:hypothetical protein
MPEKSIAEVLQAHTKELMAVSGVVGVGEGSSRGKACIRVFVSKTSPRLLKKIPASLEGYAVYLEETGEFKAL